MPAQNQPNQSQQFAMQTPCTMMFVNPNMNGLYGMFGGVQQFQNAYNQVQQAFNQLRQQGMTPEQAAAQILQQNNVPQEVRSNMFQQANSMFGPAPGVQNPNPIQGGNNYGNNFGQR